MNALTLPGAPPSLLRGPLGENKLVAWASPLDLDEIKAVGRACDCTVNDILMATATGALRDYMLARGENVEGLTLRATVPVNLRPLEHAGKLGNSLWSGVSGITGRRSQSGRAPGTRRACRVDPRPGRSGGLVRQRIRKIGVPRFDRRLERRLGAHAARSLIPAAA